MENIGSTSFHSEVHRAQSKFKCTRVPSSSYKELKWAGSMPCSVLQYNKSLAEGTTDILYLYVSTSTFYNGMISVFDLMVKNDGEEC